MVLRKHSGTHNMKQEKRYTYPHPHTNSDLSVIKATQMMKPSTNMVSPSPSPCSPRFPCLLEEDSSPVLQTEHKVYIASSLKGKCFHSSSTCSGLRSAKAVHAVTLQNATAMGMGACLVCKPISTMISSSTSSNMPPTRDSNECNEHNVESTSRSLILNEHPTSNWCETTKKPFSPAPMDSPQDSIPTLATTGCEDLFRGEDTESVSVSPRTVPSFVDTSPPFYDRSNDSIIKQQLYMNVFDETQQGTKLQYLQFDHRSPMSNMIRDDRLLSVGEELENRQSQKPMVQSKSQLSLGFQVDSFTNVVSEKRDDSSPVTCFTSTSPASSPSGRDQSVPINVVPTSNVQSQWIVPQSQGHVSTQEYYHRPPRHYPSPPSPQQKFQHKSTPFNLKPRPYNNSYQRNQSHPPYLNQSNSVLHSPKPSHTSYSPKTPNQSLTSPHKRANTRPYHTPSPVPSNTQPSNRSSPEILKTLLRKKACLYEPGTSRAIALVTWLVGRSLALRHGYFSRQHLQSGVHAVVADRIESGIITRTKANRCMQIILNSCFYYIIPKPDGTEESGECFKEMFKLDAKDDSHLLNTLPDPWRKLKILDSALVKKEHSSGPSSSSTSTKQENDDKGKRHVLLCFNENVRCALDVLRCHDEFIRDATISANLVLSPEEWKSFYLDVEGQPSPDRSNASHSPNKVSSNDSEIPFLSFEKPSSASSAQKENAPYYDPNCAMPTCELAKFRTNWCCKRYEHDATLCKFAHLDVNKGWLRRDPTVIKYAPIMCPHAGTVHNEKSPLNGCYINACKDGKMCKFAHSQEEIDYHPENYKRNVCQVVKEGCSSNSCDLLDICPHRHKCNPNPSYLSPLHHGGTKCGLQSPSQKGHVISCKHATSMKYTDIKSVIPAGPPTIYLNPAPYSELDKYLYLPGLQSLYRRNCASVYSHENGGSEVMHTTFGNDCGTTKVLSPWENLNESIGHGFSLFG